MGFNKKKSNVIKFTNIEWKYVDDETDEENDNDKD